MGPFGFHRQAVSITSSVRITNGVSLYRPTMTQQTRALHSKLEIECSSQNSSRNSSRNEFFWENKNLILTSLFCNFWKILNITYIRNVWKPLFLTLKPLFFDPKTGFLTQNYSRTFFAKFSKLRKNGYFQKIPQLW